MKQLFGILALLSLLASCQTAKLTSSKVDSSGGSSGGKQSHAVTRYCLPKKLMQVTVTYSVQQQQRYRVLARKPKKGSKYEKDSFTYYLVSVDGEPTVKYWLEDDKQVYYDLTSNIRRGLTSTDITYVPGTHVLKSLNSSLTPQANQITTGTLKFVTAVASTALTIALGVDSSAPVRVQEAARKTDSVVVASTKTVPLVRLLNITADSFKDSTGKVTTNPVELVLSQES